MSRLPQPGSDSGVWGSLLNDFLSVAHNGDGTLKSSVLGGYYTSAQVDGLLRGTDAIVLYDVGSSSYPARATVTSDGSRPVRWRGPVAPTIGGAYAVDNLDVWEMTP